MLFLLTKFLTWSKEQHKNNTLNINYILHYTLLQIQSNTHIYNSINPTFTERTMEKLTELIITLIHQPIATRQ